MIPTEFFEARQWEVVRVTEGGKTWYEVHSGLLVVTREFATWKTRSLAAAKRCRDRQNQEGRERLMRQEEVIQ